MLHRGDNTRHPVVRIGAGAAPSANALMRSIVVSAAVGRGRRFLMTRGRGRAARRPVGVPWRQGGARRERRGRDGPRDLEELGCSVIGPALLTTDTPTRTAVARFFEVTLAGTLANWGGDALGAARPLASRSLLPSMRKLVALLRRRLRRRGRGEGRMPVSRDASGSRGLPMRLRFA